jgi:predicted enzyme related to lactoylglutathione lyase
LLPGAGVDSEPWSSQSSSSAARVPTAAGLAQFVIDVDDLDRGVTFWSAVFDADEEPLNPASSKVYRRLRLPDADVRILLQLTDDPKAGKERMHPDLETDDVEAEVRRLEALGATRWSHQQERGYDFWVMPDPSGNEFCVLQTEFPDLLAQRRTWTSGQSEADDSD